jgi:hypothetical protein
MEIDTIRKIQLKVDASPENASVQIVDHSEDAPTVPRRLIENYRTLK